MRQSHTRHAPIALALGGVCLLGIGIAGCSRNAGLDLASDEANADSVIAERANDSILRSKQELAGGKIGPKGLATTEPEYDDKPSLASRWKAPFKGVGNMLKRKPDEDEITDPFLARREENARAEERQALANASKTTAAAKAASPESQAAATAAGEKKLAMAEPAKSKSPLSEESQVALDEFLKSQEPVGVSDRALAASQETESFIRKPGTSARTASTSRAADSFGSNTVALDDSPAEDEGRSGVKAGKARPFPGAAAEDAADEHQIVAAERKPALQVSAKSSVASAAARRNPLREPEEQAEDAPAPARQATGMAIASLLKKARTAGEAGEFDEALSYATAASELAEQCSYEFTAREPSPERVVAWLEARREAAARPRTTERRQIAATRRPTNEIAATPAGFEKRTAEQVFAEEVDAAIASTNHAAASDSSFQQWAAGVGKTPAAKEESPNWPVLSQRELAASDDLWQPSRAEFQQRWTDLRGDATPRDERRPSETRLAAAESDAPAFVATAQVEQPYHAVASARASDPLIQLGQPTDLLPEAIGHGSGRGPRLAAPPPLSIEHASAPQVAKSTRASNRARTIWFATIGGLAVVVLLAFRRWAYRTQPE